MLIYLDTLQALCSVSRGSSASRSCFAGGFLLAVVSGLSTAGGFAALLIPVPFVFTFYGKWTVEVV